MVHHPPNKIRDSNPVAQPTRQLTKPDDNHVTPDLRLRIVTKPLWKVALEGEREDC
jgi:hypothetical protein